MIELDIEKDDCENAAEFIESEFFNHIYLELQSGELDNVGYIRTFATLATMFSMQKGGLAFTRVMTCLLRLATTRKGET